MNIISPAQSLLPGLIASGDQQVLQSGKDLRTTPDPNQSTTEVNEKPSAASALEDLGHLSDEPNFQEGFSSFTTGN